jgi:hypothetical protein
MEYPSAKQALQTKEPPTKRKVGSFFAKLSHKQALSMIAMKLCRHGLHGHPPCPDARRPMAGHPNQLGHR